MSKEELVVLFKDSSIDEELLNAADRVRKKYVGDEVHLRGIVEFPIYANVTAYIVD